MRTLYAVTIVRQAPHWQPDQHMETQDGWAEHAAFMDALAEEGFIILGGPIRADETEMLLIIEAPDEPTIRARFAEDPWHLNGYLTIDTIRPWTIRLDSTAR